MDRDLDLHSLLVQSAKEEGIPIAGIVDLDLALPFLDQAVQSYDHWIQAGYSGAMEYLVRGRDRRANPRLVFPEAESIFCVALPYKRTAAGAPEPSEGVRYARYLQGTDYHIDLADRLQRVMEKANQVWEKASQVQDGTLTPLKWKVCVDTSAVLERTWAALAGLGWLGKNSLLIHPQEGSYLFLGEVLINQKTGRGPSLLRNYCGNCTRCLTACPTGALERPGVLNSNRCISYWTLEKRRDLPISEEQKRKIGNWVAGCDICQEVCPFNRKGVKADEAREAQLANAAEEANEAQDANEARAIVEGGDLGAVKNGDATQVQGWVSLLEESGAEYKQRIKDSALNRVKPGQFSRNLAIAMRNTWAQMNTESQIQMRLELGSAIEGRFENEMDLDAKAEWQRTVNLICDKD